MSTDSLPGTPGLGTLPNQATRAELDDWNRRVRRLARAYAPKYRPVVLSLGYHTNLGEGLGRTYIKVDTIIRESAQWTASHKPLTERYAKQLLADMIKAGAVKAEARFREDTGRQTSSYRTLVTSLSMDRHGFTRAHDFWAPLEESSQVVEEKSTPQSTPQSTPGSTPQSTRTDFELAGNYKETSYHLSPAAREEDDQHSFIQDQNQGQTQGPAAPRPAGAEDDDPGISPWQIFTVWQSRSGDWRVFCHGETVPDRAPRSARTIVLKAIEEFKYFERTLRAYSGFEAQAKFLLSSPDERAALCGSVDVDEYVEWVKAAVCDEWEAFRAYLRSLPRGSRKSDEFDLAEIERFLGDERFDHPSVMRALRELEREAILVSLGEGFDKVYAYEGRWMQQAAEARNDQAA